MKATVSGELNTNTTDGFMEKITPLMENASGEITVDCSGLEYISSKGLRAFLTLQKQVTAKGGSLVLTDLRPEVKTVFDISGFSSFLAIK